MNLGISKDNIFHNVKKPLNLVTASDGENYFYKGFFSSNAERGNSGERHVLHIQTAHVDFHYISLFCATGLFLYLMKTSKTSGFMLLGGIESDQRHETG